MRILGVSLYGVGGERGKGTRRNFFFYSPFFSETTQNVVFTQKIVFLGKQPKLAVGFFSFFLFYFYFIFISSVLFGFVRPDAARKSPQKKQKE